MGGLSASHRLKSLNVTRSKLLSVRKQARVTIAHAQGDLDEAERRLIDIETEIASIDTDEEATPSEHAILRFIERYTEVDLEEIVQKIKDMPPEKVVRRGNTIVTILDEKMVKI